MRRIRLIALVVALLAGQSALHAPAQAHHLGWFARWTYVAGYTDLQTAVLYSANFPGGAWRSRVQDGINQWNSHSDAPVYSVGGAVPGDYDPRVSCGVWDSVVMQWKETAALGHPTAAGVTYSCVFTSNNMALADSTVVIDTDREWYTGTGDASDGFLGTCFAGCQVDAWSVLSHEFGHTEGFNHFLEADDVCPDSDVRHTMCPSVYGGTERQRTLEPHEIEAFHIIY